MSALNILRLKNCAIMTTDAATYDVDSGIVRGFGIKQAAVASWPGVIGVRGAPPLGPLWPRGLSSIHPHACCGVVSNVCCDVSAPIGTVFKPSPVPLPPLKPAMACTS
jgi:hypothetical protein